MTDAGIGSIRDWFAVGAGRAQARRLRLGVDGRARCAANADAGLTTLPFLFGTPAWAAGTTARSCVGDDCVSFAPRTDETRAAFGEFAAAAVRRYGPGGNFWDQHRALPYRPIETWQIWNEPNLSSFYRPAVDPSPTRSWSRRARPGSAARTPTRRSLLAGLTGTGRTRSG